MNQKATKIFLYFCPSFKNPLKMVETKDKSTKRLIYHIFILYFLDLTTFRAEIQKYFWWFLVQMKSLEFASEINRPSKLYRMDPTNFCLAEAEAATTTTISMTSLLTHTVAHSTRPSFIPKANNKSLKKFLSLVVSWVKVIKNWT